MPGWGATGGRWEAMDRMEEAEKAALEEAQGGHRPSPLSHPVVYPIAAFKCHAWQIVRCAENDCAHNL